MDTRNRVCIAYEFASNGDFIDNILKSGRLPLPVVKYYMHQLITAIHEMHKAGVCHRDLKLDNLVLDSDFNLKIIDFGMACSVFGNKESGTCLGGDKVGTSNYMMPEVVLGCRY